MTAATPPPAPPRNARRWWRAAGRGLGWATVLAGVLLLPAAWVSGHVWAIWRGDTIAASFSRGCLDLHAGLKPVRHAFGGWSVPAGPRPARDRWRWAPALGALEDDGSRLVRVPGWLGAGLTVAAGVVLIGRFRRDTRACWPWWHWGRFLAGGRCWRCGTSCRALRLGAAGALLALSAAVVLVGHASTRRRIMLWSEPVMLELRDGLAMHHGYAGRTPDFAFFAAEPYNGRLRWWVWERSTGWPPFAPPATTTVFPLWLPALLPLVPAAWFLLRNRASVTDACTACGYDLRGLRGATRCPECGNDVTPIAARVPHASPSAGDAATSSAEMPPEAR